MPPDRTDEPAKHGGDSKAPSPNHEDVESENPINVQEGGSSRSVDPQQQPIHTGISSSTQTGPMSPVTWHYGPRTPPWIHEIAPISNLTLTRIEITRSASEPNLARRKHYVLPTGTHPLGTASRHIDTSNDSEGKTPVYISPPRPKAILRGTRNVCTSRSQSLPSDDQEKAARFAHLAAVHAVPMPDNEHSIIWQTLRPPGHTTNENKITRWRGRSAAKDNKKDDSSAGLHQLMMTGLMATSYASPRDNSAQPEPSLVDQSDKADTQKPVLPPKSRLETLPFRPPTPPLTEEGDISRVGSRQRDPLNNIASRSEHEASNPGTQPKESDSHDLLSPGKALDMCILFSGDERATEPAADDLDAADSQQPPSPPPRVGTPLQPPTSMVSGSLTVHTNTLSPRLRVGLTQRKGRGIFATESISTGTIIARERPLIEEHHDMIPGGRRRIRDSWERYSTQKQERIQSVFPILAPIPSRGLSEQHRNILERFMTEYSFHYGQYQTGLVYEWISIANHSCAPNASVAPGDPGTLRALKEIAEGDEVTIMYTRRNSKFKCRCEVCIGRSHSRLREGWSSSEGNGSIASQIFGRTKAKRTRDAAEASSTLDPTPIGSEAGSSDQQAQEEEEGHHEQPRGRIAGNQDPPHQQQANAEGEQPRPPQTRGGRFRRAVLQLWDSRFG